MPLISYWSEVKVAQSHLTLCNPINYTVHGILQNRILEWAAFPFSRGSSQPRDWTQASCSEGKFFTSWATKSCYLSIIEKKKIIQFGDLCINYWVSHSNRFSLIFLFLFSLFALPAHLYPNSHCSPRTLLNFILRLWPYLLLEKLHINKQVNRKSETWSSSPYFPTTLSGTHTHTLKHIHEYIHSPSFLSLPFLHSFPPEKDIHLYGYVAAPPADLSFTSGLSFLLQVSALSYPLS